MFSSPSKPLGKAVAAIAALVVLASWLQASQIAPLRNDRPECRHLIGAVPYEKWQRRNWCGPACLAMVLGYWNGTAAVSQREIAAEIFDPASQASFNSDLVLYPRSRNFQSYSCEGNIEILKALVRDDIPVIVLSKALKRVPKGHYRVVIGFDEAANRIIFHDPLLGARRSMPVKRFMRAWRLGPGRNQLRWMMAVVPPARSLPVSGLASDPLTSINLATAFYRKGNFAKSREEWEKVRRLIGRDPLPIYSLGLVRLKEGQADEAESLAKEALRLDAGCAPAYDVLGLAYAAQGRIVESFQAFGRAVRLDPKQGYIRDHYRKVRDFYIRNAGTGRSLNKE